MCVLVGCVVVCVADVLLGSCVAGRESVSVGEVCCGVCCSLMQRTLQDG